jgi:hypothetical protein
MINRLALTFLATLLLLPSHVAAYNEPDHFMGIKFFSDLTKSLPECKKETIGSYRSYKTYDASQGICWEDRGGSYAIRYTDVFSEVRAYMVERKLAFLALDFHWEMYPQTLAIFIERYGQPTRVLNETWTNRLGAKFPNQTALWQGKRVSIMLRRHSESLDRGDGHYTTDLWHNYSAKKSEELIKKRAKGL